ncbi:MAG: ABC transporter substrate-binding protein [Reyranellaceae bacterium]
MRQGAGIGALVAIAATLILAPPAVAQQAAGRPQRIVSINLCTDQLVLELADRERIVSVSVLASDPEFSAVADKARGLPANRGLAEEIVRLRPDLVLAHKYASRQAVAMLQRLGVRVVEIDLPQDLEAVEAQILAIAAAVGAEARGRAMVQDIRRRLAALPPAAEPRPTAAIYEPSGYAFGADSLGDAILNAAGYDNLAAKLGIGGYARLGLETLLAAPPDILVVDDTAVDRRSMAQEFLDHPALRRRFADGRRVAVPRRLWICGGPSVVEAAALLAQARTVRR